MPEMKIVVLDGLTLNPGDNPWTEVESIGKLTVYDRTDSSQIIERAKDADVILTNKTPVTADTIGQLDQLKMISVLATGFNIVDVAAARRHNIPVCNVPVYGTDTVAQHVFAVLLSFIHRPFHHDQAIRDGQWKACNDFSFWLSPLIELSGLTLGIVGFGRIGRRVGEIAHAFGMKVIANSRHHKDTPSYNDFQWVDKAELFSRSDFVTLHCPQTDQNTGFVNAELIAKMKPTAILINSARGALVNEPDLANALNNGDIAGACLDVVSAEPITDDNPLLSAKNCLLTPHYAWATVAARKRLMDQTAYNIIAFAKGKPVNVVN